MCDAERAWISQDTPRAARSQRFSYENCVLNLRRENESGNDDSVHRGRFLSLGFSARHGGIGMHIWTEFKNAILPWLLAAAVVAFLIAEHRRTTAALLDANTRLAQCHVFCGEIPFLAPSPYLGGLREVQAQWCNRLGGGSD